MFVRKGLAPILIIAVLTLVVVLGSAAFLIGRFSSIGLPKSPSFTSDQTAGGENPLKKHHTYITFSSDGKTWPAGKLVRKAASVPDLIQLDKDAGNFKKGHLLIYFVDANTLIAPGSEQLGILSSSDLGKTWIERGHIKLTGKSNKGAAVDPSLIQLEDGSLRLYFFGSESTSGDPAMSEGPHRVYSATSKDGINFKVEQGVRFESAGLTDPEVIYFQNKIFMYYSVGPSSKLATSADGLNFTERNITGGNVGGVPGALALDNGVRLFGCGLGLQAAFAADGINFKLEGTLTDIKGCDPAAIKLADGRYALIYKIQEGGQPGQQPGGFQPKQP